MKTPVAVLALIVSSSASGAYCIDLEFQDEGSGIHSKSTTIEEGGSTAVSINKDITIKITPTQKEKDLVKIQAEIQKTIDGKLTTISRPSTLTHWGQPTEISNKSQDGSHWFRLKVNARMAKSKVYPTQPLDLLDGKVRSIDE